MKIKRIAWCVFVIAAVIAWSMMFMDISDRMDDYCQNWEYNTDCPVPDGFEKAMVQEPEYKPKHRMYKP